METDQSIIKSFQHPKWFILKKNCIIIILHQSTIPANGSQESKFRTSLKKENMLNRSNQLKVNQNVFKMLKKKIDYYFNKCSLSYLIQ